MLELRNITVSFGTQTIFNNLSCVIEDGDFTIIVGPNGAGKSTLFDVIAGRVKPDSGTVWLDKTNITTLKELNRAPYIGRLFQNTHLGCVPHMTVAQNLAIATYKGRTTSLRNGMSAFPHEIVEEIVKPLGIDIDKLLQTPMGSLSGGQRQLISLVMATIVKPRILLLDEPTAALDPISATRLLTFAHRYIREHKLTTLMITHDPELARTLGTKLWVIKQGTIAKKYAGAEKLLLQAHDMSGAIDYAKIQTP